MSMFGYFYLGMQSMNVARLGLEVAGDNIANANTPGYARRRLELTPGYPTQIPGGLLDQGVDVAGLRRMEDAFLQTSLQQEQGRQGGSQELLRGLRQIEGIFGTLDSAGSIPGAFATFTAAFDSLAAAPENAALRGAAINAADGLARSIRDTYQRLDNQRGLENSAVGSLVPEINGLAGELAELNREIAIAESSGGVAAPLRDRRDQVVEKLSALTGGSVAKSADGRVSFSLTGGPTLVTGQDALFLKTTSAADGTLRILSGGDGSDITDRFRGGRLGSVLYLRDDAIPDRLAELDTLAEDFVTRANALTTGAFDLQGNPGIALFVPDPPTNPGVGGSIALNPALAGNPGLLAIASSSNPGESDIALRLAQLPQQASVGLGNRSAADYVAGVLSGVGNEIVSADVAEGVSRSLVDGLTAQRDAVSGVSLDEEAVELIRHQASFEAAARFIQVLNDITEVAVNLAR